MKKTYFILKIAGLLAAMLILFTTTFAQKITDKNTVKKMVEEKNFTFIPESVSPMRGRLRYLTPGYNLIVNKDSLSADLPYFGRAYTAPIDPTEAGIKLQVKNYYYTYSPRKGGWDISIKPGHGLDVQQLYLTVFDNGSAFLRVNSNSRQPISFNGHIEAIKKE